MEKLSIINNFNKFHFIGIGGISQSALAIFMKNMGKKVTGSDLSQSNITKKLEDNGITIYYGHSKDNIKDTEVVIYTAAVLKANEELLFAKRKKLIVIERSEFLAILSKEYEHVIAVAGTHGKTTTTGMLAKIFELSGLNPTVHIGGILNDYNSNYIIGDKQFFITEACEYKDSFLTLKQDIGIVLNIENEHTDFFKNKQQIYNSFKKFCNNSKLFNIVNLDAKDKLLKLKRKKVYFSFKENKDYSARNVKVDSLKKLSFDVYYKKVKLGNIKLNSPLSHNILNALSAIAVARYYGISFSTA